MVQVVNHPILRRIVRESGAPELIELLAERLRGSDLTSLLLEVYRRRARAVRPAELMSQYVRDGFVRPAALSAARFARFGLFAYERLPAGFESIELAPVAPLGATASVANINQDWVVSAVRGLEVMSDSTNALALECAARRRALPKAQRRRVRVRLAASHRLVRGQRFSGPNSWQHFRVLAMCTAGRDEGNLGFEMDALFEHAKFYLDLLRDAATIGCQVTGVLVHVNDLTDRRMSEPLRVRFVEPLAKLHPDVAFDLSHTRPRGRGYYNGLSFQVHARAPDGELYELCDGGPVDWTAQLLEDRKERLMISGLGVDRLLTVFAPADSPEP